MIKEYLETEQNLLVIKKQILIQIKVISLCKEFFLEFLSIMFLFKTLDIEETLLNGVPVTQVSLGSKNILIHVVLIKDK